MIPSLAAPVPFAAAGIGAAVITELEPSITTLFAADVAPLKLIT